MVLDLEKFTFVDGQTVLSSATFNARFYALVRRMDALERLRIDWETSVAAVQNHGLARINESVQPLLDALNGGVAAMLAAGAAAQADQSIASAAKLAEVDAKLAEVDAKLADIEARTEAAEASFAATMAAITGFVANGGWVKETLLATRLSDMQLAVTGPASVATPYKPRRALKLLPGGAVVSVRSTAYDADAGQALVTVSGMVPATVTEIWLGQDPDNAPKSRTAAGSGYGGL
jgi:hypothetical protein